MATAWIQAPSTKQCAKQINMRLMQTQAPQVGAGALGSRLVVACCIWQSAGAAHGLAHTTGLLRTCRRCLI